MANNSTTVVIRGKTSYAKVLGEPRLNYTKDGHEWSVDVILNDETAKQLKRLGIGDRVKNKENYLDSQDYIGFRHRLERKDGSENRPLKVVDAKGNAWDPTVLIGNGSVVDVKFDVVDYGKGMKKGCYIRAIRVLDLVPYASKEFDNLAEDDPYYAEHYVPNEHSEADAFNDEVVM